MVTAFAEGRPPRLEGAIRGFRPDSSRAVALVDSLAMRGPGDARGRNVDPLDAPDDYADPWRSRRVVILAVSIALIVLVAVVWLVAR